MCMNCSPLVPQGGIVGEDCHGPISVPSWWTLEAIHKATGHTFFFECDCRSRAKGRCAMTTKELVESWKKCEHEFKTEERKNEKGEVWCLHGVCSKCGYGQRLETRTDVYGKPMFPDVKEWKTAT